MAAYILGKPLCPPWSCAVISMWSTKDFGITMGLNSLPVGFHNLSSENAILNEVNIGWQVTYLKLLQDVVYLGIFGFTNILGLGFILTPSTITLPTLTGGSSSKKNYNQTWYLVVP